MDPIFWTRVLHFRPVSLDMLLTPWNHGFDHMLHEVELLCLCIPLIVVWFLIGSELHFY